METERPAPGASGLIAGFGPGITAEMALGTWAEENARTIG
jgi:1,3,6,8-tetrahydroxynaphthalene synthase